jgi:hypothetical protein
MGHPRCEQFIPAFLRAAFFFPWELILEQSWGRSLLASPRLAFDPTKANSRQQYNRRFRDVGQTKSKFPPESGILAPDPETSISPRGRWSVSRRDRPQPPEGWRDTLAIHSPAAPDCQNAGDRS